MKMSFLRGTEEYYQKFLELQEKLRKSEEERLILEMKFNEMVQITKEEEQAYYRKLRNQYKRFLEEDRKRQERNERIMRILERVESRAAMLAAKTERFELLRQQYQAYLNRVFNNMKYNHEAIQHPRIPEESPTVIPEISEEKIDLSNHPVIRKALYGDKFDDLHQTKDLYDHPVIRKALFGDKKETKMSSKVDVVKQYLHSLSSPISGEQVLKTARSSEKIPISRATEFTDSNGSSSYKDDYLLPSTYYKSDAGSIADHIIHSIHSKPRLSSPHHNKYFSDNVLKTGDRSRSQERFCGTSLTPNISSSRNVEDVEMFSHPDVSENFKFSNFNNDEAEFKGEAKEKIKKNEVRFKDEDYKAEKSKEEKYSESLLKQEIEKEVEYLEERGAMAKDYVNFENFENGNASYEEKIDESEKPIEVTEELLPETNQEIDEILVNNDEMSSRLNLDENLEKAQEEEEEEKETKNIELETSLEPNKPELYEQEKINDNFIEGEQDLEDVLSNTNHLIKEGTFYDEDVTKDDAEHYKNDNLFSQYGEPNGDIQHNEENISPNREDIQFYPDKAMLQCDESEKSVREYDENLQPDIQYNNTQSADQYDTVQPDAEQSDELIQQSEAKDDLIEHNVPTEQHGKSVEQNKEENLVKEYDNNIQSNVEYDQHVQRNISYDESGPPTQYFEQYDESGQSVVQYDEHGQPVTQYDEHGQPLTQYDDHGQPLTQYDDHGQPLTQYDEHGQPLTQYDEHGRPLTQYDEHGQPLTQYDQHGQPLTHYDEHDQPLTHYDEHGQPLTEYDENGQPIVQYDENGQPMMQYDANGQPIMQYDQSGQPIVHYDQNGSILQYDTSGQPLTQYDESGQPIPQYDELGRPILYDDNGQPVGHYDENGQPVFQYGQGEGYYQEEQFYDNSTNEQQHYEGPKVEMENTKDVKEAPEEKPPVIASKEQNIKQNSPAKNPDQKKNVMELLDTDTESVKQDTKVSNDSDFEFSK